MHTVGADRRRELDVVVDDQRYPSSATQRFEFRSLFPSASVVFTFVPVLNGDRAAFDSQRHLGHERAGRMRSLSSDGVKAVAQERAQAALRKPRAQ